MMVCLLEFGLALLEASASPAAGLVQDPEGAGSDPAVVTADTLARAPDLDPLPGDLEAALRDSMEAVAPVDSTEAVAPVDSTALARDALAQGRAEAERELPVERPARVPIDRPPWTRLTAVDDTLIVSREELERTGAHQPVEFISLTPGVHALEGSATVPIGALAVGGSFASVDLAADGWQVRLPRLEGLDLSRLSLDRVGPGLTTIPLTSPGALRVTERPAAGPSGLAIGLAPAETVSDSALSRIAAVRGGFGWSGGGLLFADRRGRFSYGFGADNVSAERSGAVEDVSTRVAMIDFGVGTSWGRLAASARGSEASVLWKSGQRFKQDDQGVRIAAVIGDTLGPAWSLRVATIDNRLSGSEIPGIEFLRKGLRLEARWWQRPSMPAWGRLTAERDWFAIEYDGGVYAPRVNRVRAETGTGIEWERTRLDAALAIIASDRHSLRIGGRAELTMALGRGLRAGIGASRAHRAPTLDQEVLAPGNPVAEPERHDAFTARIQREGRFSFAVIGARRHLDHQPMVSAEVRERPWPEFRFAELGSRHWEVRGALSIEGGPLGLSTGIWGSRLFSIDDSVRQVPFVPDGVARAFAALRLSFFDGDFVLRPRLDALLVGEQRDFGGQRLGGHTRLDGVLIAVMAGDMDLEFRLRNLTDRRYPLAVEDPVSGGLYLDSGRMGLFVLRWRFTG